jgi:hypothetical protein
MRFRKAFEAWEDRPLTAAEIDLHDRIMDFLFETCGSSNGSPWPMPRAVWPWHFQHRPNSRLR